MATLIDLRVITTPHRTFPTADELWRWGGVEAVELYGRCMHCGCPKSGDIRVPNTDVEPCENRECLCHDADVSLNPPVVLLGVEKHWPYVCTDDALTDRTPYSAHEHSNMPHPYCVRCQLDWHTATTTATGKEGPWVPVGAATAADLLRTFHEHIRYPLNGPREVELDYHLAAAVACLTAVNHFRAATGREVVA